MIVNKIGSTLSMKLSDNNKTAVAVFCEHYSLYVQRS